MGLTTHTPDEIGDDLETALNTLVPGTFTTVSQVPPKRPGSPDELAQWVASAAMPACYLFQPEGSQQEGKSAPFAGPADHDSFVSDLRWAVMWIQERAESQDPAKDVFWPTYVSIWDALLDDFTRDDNCFGTYPESRDHSSNTIDGVLIGVITLITPFEWGHS